LPVVVGGRAGKRAVNGYRCQCVMLGTVSDLAEPINGLCKRAKLK